MRILINIQPQDTDNLLAFFCIKNYKASQWQPVLDNKIFHDNSYCSFPLIIGNENMKFTGHKKLYYDNMITCMSYCQSSVMCVFCSRLLCPYLVCFLSLFSVIISKFLSSCLGLLSMIILCIYSPVCSVSVGLVYSLLPVFLCICPALPCLALLVRIKDCIFEFILISVFLVPPCCVHVTLTDLT